MKEITGKIYYCEHCGKHMINKGSMSRHEKYCNSNPHNWHKCFNYCHNLIKTHHTIEIDEMPYSITDFACRVTQKKLYSFKLEKKNHPEYLEGLERMPLECDLYYRPDNENNNNNDDF